MEAAPNDPRPAAVVVEDEALTRMWILDLLDNEGFDGAGAADADEAIEILKARARDVKVLIADVRMPGAIGGVELAHRAHADWPWIALIVTSGNSLPITSALPPRSRFLAKPYSSDLLMRHVRELTGGAEGAGAPP